MCCQWIPLSVVHRTARVVAALVVIGSIGLLRAQEASAPTLPKAGLQVRSVSVNMDYYSNGLSNNNSGVPAYGTNLPADVGVGGNVTLDWARFTERSSFLLSYTPSYTARVRNTSLNSLNHNFFLNTKRKLAPRWTFGFSVRGDYSSLEQSLFSTDTLSNVASTPATFSDLAAGLLASKFTNNPQLGAVLTASPLAESPLRFLVYGTRVFAAAAQTSLSYSFSPRLSMTVSGGASRSQHVSDDQPVAARASFEMPDTTSGSANLILSYSLSPTTQVGGTVNTTLTSSTQQNGYTTNSMATLGKTFRRRWVVQARAGVGVSDMAVQTSPMHQTRQDPVFGGALAYKTFSHTLLGSFDRTAADSYGLGSSTTSTASASWGFRPRGAAWWIQTRFSFQQLRSDVTSSSTAFQAIESLNRAFGNHLILLVQYAYLNYSRSSQTPSSSFSESAVRVSVVWTPQTNTLR
jgi:hypothetical protein